MTHESIEELQRLIPLAADEYDAEIVLYVGPIDRPFERKIIKWCCKQKIKTNVLLILQTYGGNADAAFRITRALQGKVKDTGKFIVCAPGFCKSAGTLICVGSDDLIMADLGELGPLDVQEVKKDELFEYTSGLTPFQALDTLKDQSFLLFERHLINIRLKSGYQMSTKLASKLAAEITTGLFSKLYEQVDPLRLGEAFRGMNIAMDYGERLKTDNLKPGALETLIRDYPSHGFVIDRKEARNLFRRVARPRLHLAELIHELEELQIETLLNGKTPFISFLTDQEDLVDTLNEGDDNGTATDGTAACAPGPVGDSTEATADGAVDAEQEGTPEPIPQDEGREGGTTRNDIEVP